MSKNIQDKTQAEIVAEMQDAIFIIENFAEYVIESRNIKNVSLDQCEQIAKHALKNLPKLIEALSEARVRIAERGGI